MQLRTGHILEARAADPALQREVGRRLLLAITRLRHCCNVFSSMYLYVNIEFYYLRWLLVWYVNYILIIYIYIFYLTIFQFINDTYSHIVVCLLHC